MNTKHVQKILSLALLFFSLVAVQSQTKNGTLYATALDWPKNGIFSIKSLAKNNTYETRKIKSVKFISGNNKMTWQQTNEDLVIQTQGDKPCEAAYVFQIRFKE